VHDVSFFVKGTSKNADSVDIFIRELDKWSLIPNFAVSSSKVTINLTDKNFVGFGHESNNGFAWNNLTGDIAYNINYFIPNLRNTYINSRLHFSEDQFKKNSSRSFAVDRPFFSPFAKWAAGVNFAQFRKDSIYSGDSLFIVQRYKFNSQDYWAGYAIRIIQREHRK
jgi:hypothetical protein